MRIGTISLNINTNDLNYGAMLHSWAFQKYLQKYEGIITEIIDYTTPQFYDMNLKYPMLDFIKRKDFRSSIISLARCFSHARRFDKFEKFKKEQLTISSVHYSQEMLSCEKLDYDVIVCESDVVWSPGFFGGEFDPTFFLALPSMSSARKIAYAVSMANGQFTKQQEDLFSILLKNLDAVSCRETYAAQYTQLFYEHNVPCVLDPTLLLSPQEYEPITVPRMIDEPYVLIYYPLGYDLRIIAAAKCYAKKRDLRIVELSRYPWNGLEHRTITDAGIEEFLSLIKNSEAVFSNSFHGVCFSLIFQKEFYAFSRETGKKIEDICNRLDLSSRFVQDVFIMHKPIDYLKVQETLHRLKQESIQWIEKNIMMKP